MQLMEHQKMAVKWLQSTNGLGLLWMATGTGKTLAALAYAESLPVDAKILIICPASVLRQWQNEIKKFYGHNGWIIEGDKKSRPDQWAMTCKYKIVNYECVLRDWKYILKQQWSLVVCDEAHRLSNPRAKSVKVIKKIQTPRRIGMSASFVSNGKHDLFSPMDWIQPGCLGRNWFEFRMQYCIMLEAFPKIVGYRNIEQFNRIIAPWIFRVDKDVLTDLPSLTESILSFELSPAERKVYDEVKNELIIRLTKEQEINIPNSIVAMLRLRQVVNTCQPLGLQIESSKLSTLLDLMEDLMADKDNKVILFTSFAQTAKVYEEELRKRWNGGLIIGDTDMAERQILLEKFTGNGFRFIVGSPAIYEGLNLQAANIEIFIDTPLSFAKKMQAEGRAWRQGQKRHVQVYHLSAIKSIDEYIYKLVMKKKEQAEFTSKDILDLLR